MNKVFHGDSLEVLKDIESESVDLLCSDPPYAISFMGKSWDKALPDIGIFKECFRVLKPGAFAFVMSAPRSDVCSRMAILLEDAGFNIAFTPIYWTYASGFPKAMNIGKMVDKRNGRDQDTYKPFAAYLKECRQALGLSMKAMDEQLGTNTAYSWWEGRSSGIQLPTKAYYLRIKAILGLDDRFDELIEREEAEREVIGQKESGIGTAFGDGEWKSGKAQVVDITTAATDQAKALDGSYGGFQPKPAVEVIIVAMKPLSEKTYVDQALKNGKGITWLDDVRVPAKKEDMGDWDRFKGAQRNIKGGNYDNQHAPREPARIDNGQHERGRFPANLLVSDDVLNDGNVAKPKAGRSGRKGGSGFGFFDDEKSAGTDGVWPADNGGSYSRFFSLDAWAQTLPFLAVPKASKSEKNAGLEGFEEKQVTGGGGGIGDYLDDVNSASGKYGSEKAPSKNFHPTVKPLKLMSYLITLGSRPGDVVLDPFLGSGTTAIAAKQLGRNYIGIEREAEYVEIANARLAAVQEALV